MTRYVSPVNPAVYPHLAVTLLGIGLFFMAWFFVYPHTIAIEKGGGRVGGALSTPNVCREVQFQRMVDCACAQLQACTCTL